MHIEPFFDPTTFTMTYVVSDYQTRDAIVIDAVLDYDAASAQTSSDSLSLVIAHIHKHDLKVHYALETHAHADHLSGAQYLKSHVGAKVAIGARITEVQHVFKSVFDLGSEFSTDGTQFDQLLHEGDVLEAGALKIRVIATPGHTPACVSFHVGDALFTGDALFIEDYGVGRCDFPAGDAADLYESVHEKLYKLPEKTRVFVGHDYQPNGRALRFETTIDASKKWNIQLRESTRRDEFVKLRKERDKTLAPPKLLFPSVQVNIDGGRLPKPAPNGLRYLRLPINRLHPTNDDGSPIG